MIELNSINPGKLYGGITIDDLLTGNYTSKSRNKLIAKIFKEAWLIERYGAGIMRAQQIYQTSDIEKQESVFIRIRKAIAHYQSMKFEYQNLGHGFLTQFSYTKQKVSIILETTVETKTFTYRRRVAY